MKGWVLRVGGGCVAVLVASCLGELEPEVGDLLRPPCSDEDSVPGVDVSFENDLLGGVFANPPGACLSCHDPDGDPNLGFTLGGLDLTSYSSFTAGGVNSGGDIVVPGVPCDSLLIDKLGPAPPFGGRMPLDGPPFLDEPTVQAAADWIAEGADED